MATQEQDYDPDCFISTPLSSRGSTKRDPISVESYDRDRRRLRLNSTRTKIKTESPLIIDLDNYEHEYLSFPKLKEKLHSSSSSSSSHLWFECEICVESKYVTESFPISGCSHTYCNACVSKYIASKLQDNVLTITCPVSSCSGHLEPEKCRGILPTQVFDRWGDALCEAVVMRSKRFYCPYKDCSALVFLDEGEEMTESECPHCYRMVCVACGTKWHNEVTCEEFQKLEENERGRDDILLKKMAESKRWSRCPSCKFYVERTDGCLYIKCRCGTAFCYNCGTPFTDHRVQYCRNCKH